jgi:two-component system, OmpR family, response regulator QseB
VNAKLLVVSADDVLTARVGELLAEAGYEYAVAGTGEPGYDLMIIDRNLTGSLEMLTSLRRQAVTARALVLSTIGDSKDQEAAMAAGADDYLTTPFLPANLLRKVRGLLRRHIDNAETIPFGRAELDVRKYEVVLPKGKRVALSVREFDLLRTLVARPTVIYPKAELRTRVFGNDASESTVDTYVYYLRKKLGQGVVRSVYRLGYKAGSISA